MDSPKAPPPAEEDPPAEEAVPEGPNAPAEEADLGWWALPAPQDLEDLSAAELWDLIMRELGNMANKPRANLIYELLILYDERVRQPPLAEEAGAAGAEAPAPAEEAPAEAGGKRRKVVWKSVSEEVYRLETVYSEEEVYRLEHEIEVCDSGEEEYTTTRNGALCSSAASSSGVADSGAAGSGAAGSSAGSGAGSGPARSGPDDSMDIDMPEKDLSGGPDAV
jgi:hypothetical protein